MPLSLYLIRDTQSATIEYENGPLIHSGTTVEYMGHIPGGMVKIKYKDQILIIHPESTKELSISKPAR